MARKVKKSKKKAKAKKVAKRTKKKTTRMPAKKAIAKKATKRPRKAKLAKAAKEVPDVRHPGMMGDGTEEQNLNQPGNFKARIKQDEVDDVFRTQKK
jgi:hypothetical protein